MIDLLKQAIDRQDDGKFVREEIIHKLIMPMRTTTYDSPFDAANLWLIDEGLAFHEYLASDKPLASMEITGAVSGTEPDILGLYGKFKNARTPGEISGARKVKEIAPSGKTRSWYESYDHQGTVRIVRPFDGRGYRHYIFGRNGKYVGRR